MNTLTNPPLVEALLEIKWKLEEFRPGSDIFIDPGFEVAHINFAQIVKQEFPVVEPLSTAQVPFGILSHVPKYRYRTATDGWPLVQLGPGIATLNYTSGYSWSHFRDRAEGLLDQLQQAYDGHHLQIESLQLRYINAETYDFTTQNAYDFLPLLNVGIDVTPIMANRHPATMSFKVEYPLDSAAHVGIIKIGTGTRRLDGQELPCIIWELICQTTGTTTPQFGDGSIANLVAWLDQNHDLIEGWFFATVSGELLERYK